MRIKQVNTKTCIVLCRVLILLALGAASIQLTIAQETEDFEVWDSMSESMDLFTEMQDQVEEISDKELLIRLGVVGGVAPEYNGSDEYQISYAPNIHIVWNDFLFIKGRKLGVQAFNSEHFYGGAFVRYTGGRSEDNDGLAGLGDISRTFTSGAYLNYRYQGIRLKTEVRHDFFNEGHGTLVLASLGSRVPWNKPLFYIGVETAWASTKNMNTFFGIDAFQSLRSGLSQYRSDSGIRDVALNLSSAYKFNKHWSLAGQISYRHLLDNAAASPIVKDVGTENNFIVGLGLNYTF